MPKSHAVSVTEPSQAGEARRLAAALAADAGLDETTRGFIALVATELANNLALHARGGELILRVLDGRGGEPGGMELLSLDRGPGMADVRRCLEDGYSTGGTRGVGLGAVRRQSHEFDIASAPGQGTALLSRIWAPDRRPDGPPGVEVGAVCLPVAGEVECGDAWAIAHPGGDRTVVMVADGLGHGPQAAEASRAAIGALGRGGAAGPSDLLRAAQDAMAGTRGGAVAVATIDHARGQLTYGGVGNIAGVLVGPSGRAGLVSHNGILGAGARRFQDFTSPWAPGSILVMHSDGVNTQWRLDRNTPLAARHPALIAGALYRDHARARDDSTVVVVRQPGAAGR